MRSDFFIYCFFILIFLFSQVSAIPFIVGRVNDALDGTIANGRTVILWNPSVGLNDNVTDIIGPSGNSGTDNIYLIDCDLLDNGCDVGQEMNIMVNGLDGYITNYTSFIVQDSGFQVIQNFTLNSPSIFNFTFVDDFLSFPAGEVDLNAGTTQMVHCQGTVYDMDNETNIQSISSEFFDSTLSFYGDSDDNNYHYTNSSCNLNYTYGDSNEASFICTHEVYYYSNSANWNCTISLDEVWGNNIYSSNQTFINPLLAIEVPSSFDFGEVDSLTVSSENIINVTNFGNVLLNLSLEGYANFPGDNYSMNCTSGFVQNISIGYQKFNLTAPNPGNLNLNGFESLYSNLTSTRVTRMFGLNYRQSDFAPYLDDTNATYWRIYVPFGVDGSCTGNIVFGADAGLGV